MAQFASKIGLVAATVGSAVGLGTIWRFPAEAQANGGAAFLLLYILCVLLLGIPVMVSEFALGRAGHSDAIGSMKNVGAARPWWSIGVLAIVASYVIMWFYTVVAGWSLEYLWVSLTGSLYDHGSSAVEFGSKMKYLTQDPAATLAGTVGIIAINIGILIVGVQKGIERLSNILMPLLFVILVVLCCTTLSLPNASEGVEYFFHPDFSKITPAVAINALGQAFFSLSLGMGILVTYASYFPRDTRLAKTSVTVSALVLLVAILTGLIIFPAVASFGLEGESMEGATLVFVTLPEVFAHMSHPQLWSILFFALLLVAAITSTISIGEVSVAFMEQRCGMSRRKAVLVVMLPLLLFSTVCALSNGPLSHITICGMNIFDFLDFTLNNFVLPVVALGTCIYVGWVAPRGFLHSQLTNDGTIHSGITPVLLWCVRLVAPALIIVVLVSNI